MTDNSFFREVDEAVRQERYKVLGDKYGLYVLGVAVLLVVGVAGYNGWAYYKERESQSAGTEFTQALTFERGADSAKADETFEALIDEGPKGYRVLSRFQLAASQAKAGETAKAVEAYDALAVDGRVDPILQGLATLQGATLRLDGADYAEMERRLNGLIENNSAWRYSARELLGLSAYQHKDFRVAEEQFAALLGDQGTPPNMRERANMMLALIVSNTTPQTSPTTN